MSEDRNLISGIEYFDRGMIESAIHEWEKAVELNSNRAEAHNILGFAYEKKGMLEEAIAEYKKAIGINPNYAMAHINLWLAYGKKRHYGDGYIELMRALARRGPNLIVAHHSLAITYLRAGEFEKAISEWKEIVSLLPGIAGVHFNLGITYRKTGLLHEAISEYKKAVQIKPSYAKAHNNLAILYSATAHYDLGWKHFKIAKALGYPAHPNLEGLFRGMLKKASRS